MIKYFLLLFFLVSKLHIFNLALATFDFDCMNSGHHNGQLGEEVERTITPVLHFTSDKIKCGTSSEYIIIEHLPEPNLTPLFRLQVFGHESYNHYVNSLSGTEDVLLTDEQPYSFTKTIPIYLHDLKTLFENPTFYFDAFTRDSDTSYSGPGGSKITMETTNNGSKNAVVYLEGMHHVNDHNVFYYPLNPQTKVYENCRVIVNF